MSNIRSGQAGDLTYDAYVGPPGQYDFMGATQFRLLTALGLREHHHVLDFGCGSLRAGRLLIPYLSAGRYFGIEPNAWLIEQALDSELGRDIVAIKQPQFAHVGDFSVPFDESFDFVIAQSIFSHASRDQIATALANFGGVLKPGGIVLATFIEGAEDYAGSEWQYPHCVSYRPQTIAALAVAAGLSSQKLPWYHPRQTWYLLSMIGAPPLNSDELSELTGVVLRDQELRSPGAAR